MRNNWRLLCGIVVVLAIMAGCSAPAPSPTAAPAPTKAAATSPQASTAPTAAPAVNPPPAATSAPAVKPSGTVTILFNQTMSPNYVSPMDAATPNIPSHFLYAIQDAVLKPMPDKPIINPSLAESYTVSPDGLVYEFKLRKGAKFHNGDEVTAEDVQFSFDRYKGLASADLKAKLKELTVVDRYTVRLTLKQAWPDFLITYGHSQSSSAAWVVPKKYVQEVGTEGYVKKPIGAGPYKFVEYTPDRLVLEAFEDYWAGPPSVKTIIIRGIPEPATRLASLLGGEADFAMGMSGDMLETIRKNSSLKVAPYATGGNLWLDFPEQWNPKSPWSDIRVRQAASLAIDRTALNDAFHEGLAPLNGNFISQDTTFSLKLAPHPYDPEKAKALLKEAGYASGSLKTRLTPFVPYPDIAQAIVTYWRNVGIDVSLNNLERQAYLDLLASKKATGAAFMGSGFAASAAVRVDRFLRPEGQYGVMPVGAVPEIEDLWKKQATEVDAQKRGEILGKIQQIVYDRVIMPGILDLRNFTAAGPRIEVAPVGRIPNYGGVGPYQDIRLKK